MEDKCKNNQPETKEFKNEATAVPEKTELNLDELGKVSGGETYEEYLKDIEENTIPIFF